MVKVKLRGDNKKNPKQKSIYYLLRENIIQTLEYIAIAKLSYLLLIVWDQLKHESQLVKK